jgi:hypothetical protein
MLCAPVDIEKFGYVDVPAAAHPEADDAAKTSGSATPSNVTL